MTSKASEVVDNIKARLQSFYLYGGATVLAVVVNTEI